MPFVSQRIAQFVFGKTPLSSVSSVVTSVANNIRKYWHSDYILSPVNALSNLTMGGGELGKILDLLDMTARLGHVPADALIGRLYAYHFRELSGDRQRLIMLEQQSIGLLRRLDAQFPVALPPEPEKPLPPRGRSFGRISRDMRGAAQAGSLQ